MEDLSRQTFQDSLHTCIDCGKDFIFTRGEALFFASKGMSVPKRCPECRRRRKFRLVTREMEAENGREL